MNDRPAEQHQRSKTPHASDASDISQMGTGPPTFSSLPVELHDLVFQELDIEDVLALSFTDQYFWEVGQGHIKDYFLSLLGPWAGESIICVGDYLNPGDYPPGELTQAQLGKLSQFGGKYGDGHVQAELMSLRGFLEDPYEKVKSNVEFSSLIAHVATSKRYSYHLMPEHLQSRIETALSPTLSQFYPVDEPWILRNLTTQEYVRSEAIALDPKYIHGPRIEYLGFSEVILSRVCWSSDPSISMKYGGGIHRGVWAGDRFDITTLARHEQNKGEGKWEDVSEEVAKEIKAIWDCCH
ncbi:MAG: hypothetical protein M1813_000081 [Trichoglossum hirsutum]|nr:MAG: hypothetical protein M1813_000081 [Trichoglossum hirsutum]